MSRLRRSLLLSSLVVTGVLAAGVTNAAASVKVCLPVLAHGVGHDNGDFTTDATISSLGFMVGTSHAEFMPTDSPPDRQNFAGTITFTTALGKLYAPVAGSFFPTGEFTARSNKSVSGTGLLRGVTGMLDIRGTEDFQTFDFTEKITGRLCL